MTVGQKRRQPGTEADTLLEALLDAAMGVFAVRGYRASRLEDVADAAGVTKGAIYYYFRGKEDLLRRALQGRHRAMFADLARPLEEIAPASARIRLVLRRMWQHWLVPGTGQAIRLVLGEVSVELPALFRAWAEEGPVAGWSLVRGLIEVGIARGEFRTDVDAEVAARSIVSGLMLQAMLHHLELDDAARCDMDRIFDSALDLFLHGLSVTHGPPRKETGRESPG